MAKSMCSECGKDVEWNPGPGRVQTSGTRRLCEECEEAKDTFERELDKSIEADAFPNK